MLKLIALADGFEIQAAGRTVLRHAPGAPCLFIGRGEADVQMQRGNFAISDYVSERIALRSATPSKGEGLVRIGFAAASGGPELLAIEVVESGHIRFMPGAEPINRLWLRVPAEVGENVWGGGEQLSYFDMRGRHFPLWTSEPGVGRDKSTQLTWMADQAGAGGDYFHTNYPQPTFISSRRYALHVETTAYSAFDFRHADFHEIEVWEVPERIEIFAAETFVALVGALSDRFGRQPPLPDWVLNGAIVGLKQGGESFDRLQAFIASGAALSGLWCEDWVGLRITSFGKRLFWDWKWNTERYPGLDRKIGELAQQGIRFLGYVNPYLCVDGSLFPIAEKAGYLALRQDSDETYLVDFGEFDCGVVDFTNPEAADWFADAIIGKEMLDFGLSGWMADFGEYLPTDVRLANGVDGMLMHNAWPTIWAKVNADAVERRGKTGEAVFFMRAGYSGVQRYCPLLWAGDQSVDFTRHDGIGTVVCAALSSGLLGNAYHHSDIGGYTSLFGNVRTAELLMRWSEMAAFTAVMRSHEGNRPDQNLQLDQDPQVLAHFARMTRVYRHLAPYLRDLRFEASEEGLPLQRPLFLHHEDDPRTYAEQTQYLFGRDLLVAPVLEAGVSARSVYLPTGAGWVHVWSGETFDGGQSVEIAAPFGQPPVFHRVGADQSDLFQSLRSL
ncbi:alpha-glucosidase [Caulobacter sp. ErkDOM-YI]|uniref:alpha-glucosidase n=1 Tax=unclassified Caulobacter TaxID=2648921 RepID=UPI003AF44F7D